MMIPAPDSAFTVDENSPSMPVNNECNCSVDAGRSEGVDSSDPGLNGYGSWLIFDLRENGYPYFTRYTEVKQDFSEFCLVVVPISVSVVYSAAYDAVASALCSDSNTC